VNNKGKPLVQAGKSSAQAQSKPSVSAKTTKRETTGSPNERIDIEVFDYWLEGLDVPTLDSFYSFAKDTFSPIQVYLYSRFLGYRGSIVAAEALRIASLQKELRSTISQVDSFTSSRDNKGLLMAGADRAIRELMLIFKDDPIEGPLHEASMSVWAKMQFED
jgi:hypothetical protein